MTTMDGEAARLILAYVKMRDPRPGFVLLPEWLGAMVSDLDSRIERWKRIEEAARSVSACDGVDTFTDDADAAVGRLRDELASGAA
jgi:hypothetical protein